MKKMIVIILMMLLLCGCAAPQGNETTSAAAVGVIPAEISAYQGDPIILEANWDLDLYSKNGLPQIDLYFISPEPVKEEDVSISFPADIPCTYQVHQSEFKYAPNQLTLETEAWVDFHYVDYLHYCDFDWEKLAQLFDENPDMAKAYFQQHYYSYLQLSPEMLPQYYYYHIAILTEYLIEEEVAFNTIDLTINGKTTTVDIGECRLHTEVINPENPVDEKMNGLGYDEVAIRNDLSAKTTYVNRFEPKEEMLLTGVQFLTGNVQYSSIRVTIDEAGGNSLDFTWDGKMPLTLPAGSTVTVEIHSEDERLTEPGYSFRVHCQYEFEIDGVAYQHIAQTEFSYQMRPYEAFAQFFDGYDYTDYYEKYYYPIVLGIES